MKYSNSTIGEFISRPTRFTAQCLIDGVVTPVHVKNTGRGKEVLVPGALVSLVHTDNPTRKTAWDLVAVKKGDHWINIDSQATNKVVKEAVANGTLTFEALTTPVADFKGEVVYGESRLDFMGHAEDGQAFFVEVKGVTLENKRVAAFPDAPTERAVKHVHELIRAVEAGYQSVLCFVLQMDYAKVATIYRGRAPKLFLAIEAAQQAGVTVMAVTCDVTPQTLTINGQVPFDLCHEFHEAN